MDECYKMEVENRIRNLMWTVSGDYELDTEPDVSSFFKSKYISIYDAVKQGAFSRYFDKNLFGLYMAKKVYLGAEETSLVQIGQLCVDSAVFPKIAKERIGVPDIRKRAFEDILDTEFEKLAASFMGSVKLAVLRGYVTGNRLAEKRVREAAESIAALEGAADTMDLIRVVDRLYNTHIDRGFERKHGNLETVLAVTNEQLKTFDWQDYLDEEIREEQLERYLNRMADSMTKFSEEEKEERQRGQGGAVFLDEEAIEKMYSYIELNYGRSYLSGQEQKRINYKVCRGLHGDCTLYFTDGILANMVRVNSQSEYARKTKEINLRTWRQNYRVAKRNIDLLRDTLKRSLLLRSEREVSLGEYGKIVPNRLWKIGRTDSRKLFEREFRRDSADFVVDVLIDASGSQRARQSQVALQAFIISRALSGVLIPHRVMGFCTFWDYTVMRRFREYDEGAEADERIFEFYGSSNNRDGLAIRAAALGLEERPEEHKILIVLSDGRPNDIIVNRPNSRNPEPYFGDFAVKDTAFEVRKLRSQGTAVLGVFVGEEQDLQAERRIFGKDFAYIRNIGNFANVVGRYLKKQLEE